MPMSSGALMQYGEKQALAAVTRQAQSPATGNTWLALITAAPTATDLTMASYSPSIEYDTATGYARQVFGAGAPSSASPSVISNSGTITYGPFTVTPTNNPCTWAILCDAVSGTTANNICAFLLTNSRSPLIGDSLQAAATQFTIQV